MVAVNFNGVILDRDSFDRDDIDPGPLNKHPVKWASFGSTPRHLTIERISDMDIIITNKVIVDRKVLDSTDTLKLVLVAATGTDNVDAIACQERGIVVCNVRHYATPAVVQHTFALMLNLMTSQLKYATDVESGQWSKSGVFCLLDHPIVEAEGKVFGILGYGTLGKRVANVARTLGMKVVVSQRPGSSVEDGRISFQQLLATSDVISLHCPLTAETHNLFSTSEFRQMKPGAIIINTARGAIIDSIALVNALRNGEISGAGIDVLDREPPPPDHPLLQTGIPNLIVTPHNAWGTRESRQRLVAILGENLQGWLSGKPENVINP